MKENINKYFEGLSIEDFNNTDTGNAKILAHIHGDEVRWCDERGWMFFNGRYWESTSHVKIESLARDVPKYLHEYASKIDENDKRQAIAIQSIRAESNSAIKAMANLLKSEPNIAVSVNKFDSDPWLLNLQNGTIDLKTGLLRPHNRNDVITHIANAKYDPKAKAEKWKKYLDDVMCGDGDLVEYLQRYMGYILTGSTKEQSFLFFSGSGANGKSRFTETAAKMMGTYGSPLSANALVVKYGTQQTNELAGLAGLRYVYCGEVDSSKTIDSAMIKNWTGEESLKCRFLFKELFTLKPQFKLIYSANGDPKVKDDSYGFWRRCKKIPFKVSFKDGDARRDPNLQDKLNMEIDGILIWALDGLAKYLKEGIGNPQAVSNATHDYQTSMSDIRQYLEEKTVWADESNLSLEDLHRDYVIWCEKNGETPITKKGLKKKLEEYGYEVGRVTKGTIVKGLAFKKA
ncbi:MAG: hypothetical protein AGIKBDMD_00292 [Synergistaceae bacterium]